MKSLEPKLPAVRSIAWLGLSLQELCDFGDCCTPFADTLPILTVRPSGANVRGWTRATIPLLNVATLAGTEDDPIGGTANEGDRSLSPGDQPFELSAPPSGQASSRLSFRRVDVK
jgi:hypothetical protein